MRGEPWLKPPVVAKPSGDGMWEIGDADGSTTAYHMREIDAKEVAARIEAASHLPINGSGTRVWPGKVQWVRYPKKVVPKHMPTRLVEFAVGEYTVLAIELDGDCVALHSSHVHPSDCFDTEAEAMAAKKGAE